MFDIPDDDDDLFWQTLPMEDITNNAKPALKSTGGKREAVEAVRPGDAKRLRSSQADTISAQLCTETSCQNSGSHKALPNLSTSNLPSAGQKDASTTAAYTDGLPKSLSSMESYKTFEAGLSAVETDRTLTSTLGSWPSTPGIPGRLVSRPAPSPLPVPSPGCGTPRPSTRKFPGPAGLLPQQASAVIISDTKKSCSPDSHKSEEPLLSSQSGEVVFTEAPWQALLADLGAEAPRVLKKFSIATTLFLASRRRLCQGKVPLVLAVLESVDIQEMAASAVLKDRSGSMPGSIHRDLLKEHGTDLQPGTAIVLRQVGVLSPTSRTHYLNITPANLVALYPNRDGGTVCVRPPGQQQDLQTVVEAEERHARKSVSPASQTAAARCSAVNSHNVPVVRSGLGGFRGGPGGSVSGVQGGQSSGRTDLQAGRPGEGNTPKSRQFVMERGGPAVGPAGAVGGAGVHSCAGANSGTSSGSLPHSAAQCLSNQRTDRNLQLTPVSSRDSKRFLSGVAMSPASAPRDLYPASKSSSAGSTPVRDQGQTSSSRFRFRTPTTPRSTSSLSAPSLRPLGASTPTSSRTTPLSVPSRGGTMEDPADSLQAGGRLSAVEQKGKLGNADGLTTSSNVGKVGVARSDEKEAMGIPDSLWDPWPDAGDELSDELLSQLSEDMF